MNIKRLKYIILIIIAFVFANIISLSTAFADTQKGLSLIGAKWRDSEGNVLEYDLNNLTYKSRIVLTYTATADKYQIVTYRKDLSGVYTEYEKSQIFEVKDNEFSHRVLVSGEIKIEAIIYNFNETRLDSLEIAILSDNTMPNITFDNTQLDIYSLTPINIYLTINKKEIGEIDFVKSNYHLSNDNGYIIFPTKFINTYQSQFLTLTANGTLSFEIYDKSGNVNRQDYQYSRMGFGEEVIPTITVTPDQEYVKEVTVTITWGENNDKNPNVVKQYEIYVNSIMEGSRKNYNGSFKINSAGKVEIRAFYRYSPMGDFNYVSKTVNNIDPIPPSDVIIRETIGYKVDLSGAKPVILSFTATDNLGIKRVYYFDSKEEFSQGNFKTYSAPLNTNNAIIAIEDYAGNVTLYTYINTLNFKMINEYNKKLLDMDKSLYSDILKSELNIAVIELNSLLLQNQPSNSEIARLTEKIDRCILGEYQKKLIVEQGIGNYSGAFTFNVGIEDFTFQNILLGELFTLTVGQPKANSEQNTANLNLAKTISGFDKTIAYTLNLNLKTDSYKELTLLKGVPITYTLSSEFSKSKVKVFYNSEGVILEVKSFYINNILFFDMPSNCDYYFVIEDIEDGKLDNSKGFIINGKFYSYGLIFGVGGGIVAIVVILSFILILKNKKRVK